MSRFSGILLLSIVFLSFSYGQSDHKEIPFIKKVLLEKDKINDQIYITDHYRSKGITHTYFKESINDIPVYNSRGAIHYKEKTDVILKQKLKRIPKEIIIPGSPTLSAVEALERLALIKGLDLAKGISILENPKGKTKSQKIRASSISLRDIPSSLEYYYLSESNLRLVWQLPIEHINTAWYTNYLVDANSGEILAEVDWTVECDHGAHNDFSHECDKDHNDEHLIIESQRKTSSIPVPNAYQVFAWPIESPNFGVRTSEASPWLDNTIASPNGWHTIGANSYTTTRGNNTDTYIDNDNTNSPTGGDAARADGGANLDFSFPLDVDMDPSDFKEAAITNTFYWTNLMHDVWYNYGFDEASGNFQEENYSANGAGSDYVRSEAQDGSGTCNANFGTPPDGANPRMQMYLCNGRDGDYDNVVIAHEYGHGISNRLTGGPASSGCLNNREQMGEGWSDFFGIVMTIEDGDTAVDPRTVGTWLFGQGPNGNGIRPYPYSTDFGENPMTYNNIKTLSVPHGLGSVWCTMLWDMTWAFIDEYGFDADLYNGIGGNNIAMELVMEGMKLQPCNPGFVDGRDAILEADELLNGGANSCLIWKAFAARGLGFNASQGSEFNRLDGIESFDSPPSCRLSISKSTPVSSAQETEQISYQIIVANNFPDINLTNIILTDTIPQDLVFVSASDGGAEALGIISFPIFDLLSGEADTFNIVLEVKEGISNVLSDFYDDMESGTSNWATTSFGNTNWSTQTTVSNSGTTAWFAPNNSSEGVANLDLVFEVGLGSGAELGFYHRYDTENNWDGGQVYISNNEGNTWTDLGPLMIANGYNSKIYNKDLGFSGNSNGFLSTLIDLDQYSGQSVIIRFQMHCDQGQGGNGWWIDDFTISNLNLVATNKAAAMSGIYSAQVNSNPVQIESPVTVLKASLTKSNVICGGEANGEIFINPTGGSGSYTYLWNDGSTVQNRTNLSGGIYKVTVSDGFEQLEKVGIVAEPIELGVTFIIDNVSNFSGDNGSLEADPIGGTGSYSYLWDNGATTSMINNLVEGVYSITITDENNCEHVDSAEVIKYGCGDDHYDSGGPTADYSNNEDRSVVICPDTPNEAIVITFNALDIEVDWDALYVYNGNSINSPIFDSGNSATQAGFPAGGYYGTTTPGPFTASNVSGCITLRFRSDQYVTGDGWDIDITCATCAEEVFKINPDGYGSLKQQILCADPIDVIAISSSIYLDTISLDSTIIIDKELIIDAGSGNTVTILSNQNGPIFNVAANGSLELNHLNLVSGETDPGGAIINNGILILKNVGVYENVNNPGPDGLILNNGQLFIQGATNIKKE